MPRNRYTRLVRKEELIRLAQQEQDLLRVARKLRHPDAEPLVSASHNEDKEHRRGRLTRKQRHTAGRVRAVRGVQSFVISVVAAGITITGCGLLGEAPSPGKLDELQHIEAACDPAKPPANLVAMDATGSSSAPAITGERLAAVEQIVTRTAVCGGRVKVNAFSSSSVASVTLLDKALRAQGATVNARLKRVPALVDQAMATIRKGYVTAMASLPGGGSDITGQFRHAAEWQRQLGGAWRLRFHLFTDGFHNVGHRFGRKALSLEAAKALAAKTSVPKLPGAVVTIAGLGRVAGDPPSSRAVEGLVAYYDVLCARTKADECTSVTDYAGLGR